MRKWRNKSDFESSNEILAINVGVIIFEKFHLKSIFELSRHIMSYHFLSYFFVVHNFNLLGLYLNLELWEKKFLRSAIVTKSNNQNLYFKTILPIINHRNYEENFIAVWERCKNRNCSLQVRLFKFPSLLFSSLFSFRWFSGWLSILVDFKRNPWDKNENTTRISLLLIHWID